MPGELICCEATMMLLLALHIISSDRLLLLTHRRLRQSMQVSFPVTYLRCSGPQWRASTDTSTHLTFKITFNNHSWSNSLSMTKVVVVAASTIRGSSSIVLTQQKASMRVTSQQVWIKIIFSLRPRRASRWAPLQMVGRLWKRKVIIIRLWCLISILIVQLSSFRFRNQLQWYRMDWISRLRITSRIRRGPRQ